MNKIYRESFICVFVNGDTVLVLVTRCMTNRIWRERDIDYCVLSHICRFFGRKSTCIEDERSDIVVVSVRGACRGFSDREHSGRSLGWTGRPRRCGYVSRKSRPERHSGLSVARHASGPDHLLYGLLLQGTSLL